MFRPSPAGGMSGWSREAIEAAAVVAAANLGYPQLLPEQKQVIASFVEGQAGCGKTLCFAAKIDRRPLRITQL